MRTYRGKGPKIAILVIVCVLLTGFSIGFSALSKSLLIKSHASIRPDSALVYFSSNENTLETNDIVPTVNPDTLVASNAKINNSASIPTISNFNIELTEPGDTVQYAFYAMNVGEVDVYLTSIIYNNVSGESTFKSCSPIVGTDESTIGSICGNIKFTLQIGNLVTQQGQSVTNHILKAGESEKIIITVEFLNTDSSILSAAGDFIVEFGDISLLYTLVDVQTDGGYDSGDDDVETGGWYGDVETGGGYNPGTDENLNGGECTVTSIDGNRDVAHGSGYVTLYWQYSKDGKNIKSDSSDISFYYSDSGSCKSAVICDGYYDSSYNHYYYTVCACNSNEGNC